MAIGIVEGAPGTLTCVVPPMGNVTLTLRPLDESLPKAAKLFPTQPSASLGTQRTALVRAVRKAAAVIKAKGADRYTAGVFGWKDRSLTFTRALGTSTSRPAYAEWRSPWCSRTAPRRR